MKTTFKHKRANAQANPGYHTDRSLELNASIFISIFLLLIGV